MKPTPWMAMVSPPIMRTVCIPRRQSDMGSMTEASSNDTFSGSLSISGTFSAGTRK